MTEIISHMNMRTRWLIIRSGGIGDSILLSTVIQRIRMQNPDAWIEVAGIQERVELLVGQGMADHAVSSDMVGMETLYSQEASSRNDLRGYLKTFDIILCYSAGNPELLASKLRSRDNQIIRIHPALPDKNAKIHITEFYMQALTGLVEINNPPFPRIELNETEIEMALKQLAEINFPNTFLLGMHIGAGNKEKRVSPHIFLRVIHYLSERMPVSVLLAQGPAEEGIAETFITKLPRKVRTLILNNEPLRQLAGKLSFCDLFIGNDSGVTHLAAAVQCPTLALFIASDPVVWRPLGEHVRIIDFPSSLNHSTPDIFTVAKHTTPPNG